MKRINLLVAIFILSNISFLYSQDDLVLWKKTLSHIGVVNTAIFSPDENFIANGAGKYVQSRDALGEVINNFDGGDATIMALAYSPNEEFIYSGAGDTNNPNFEPLIIKWDVKTGELNNIYEVPNAIDFDMVESIDVSPDDKYLIAVFRSKSQDNLNRNIALWDIETTELLKTSKQNDARIHTNIKFSSDSKSIVINVGKTIEKFSIPSLESLGKFGDGEQQHTDDVRDFDISKDGEKIATVSFDGFIKLWDFKTNALLLSYKPSMDKKKYFKVELVDDANSVFVAEKDSPNLELFSLKYKRKFTSYKSFLSYIKDFTVSNDFQKILIADSSSLILMKSNYYLVNEVGDSDYSNISILPNPITDRGQIIYSLQFNGLVSLKLYNYQGILAKNIFNEFQTVGEYHINIDSKQLKSGIYYLILRTKNYYKVLPIEIIH